MAELYDPNQRDTSLLKCNHLQIHHFPKNSPTKYHTAASFQRLQI